MIEKIIIAGAGGQGIMLLGKVLAEAGLKQDKFITWFPSYGAEVRGGAAYCMVVISDEEISSPYVEKADTLIVMNEPSLEKFKNRIKNKGLFIVNSSLVSRSVDKKDVEVIKQPFTDIALKLGNIRIANMVVLGCYIAKKKIIDKENIFKVMDEIAPPDKRNLIAINKKALEEGINLK